MPYYDDDERFNTSPSWASGLRLLAGNVFKHLKEQRAIDSSLFEKRIVRRARAAEALEVKKEERAYQEGQTLKSQAFERTRYERRLKAARESAMKTFREKEQFRGEAERVRLDRPAPTAFRRAQIEGLGRRRGRPLTEAEAEATPTPTMRTVKYASGLASYTKGFDPVTPPQGSAFMQVYRAADDLRGVKRAFLESGTEDAWEKSPEGKRLSILDAKLAKETTFAPPKPTPLKALTRIQMLSKHMFGKVPRLLTDKQLGELNKKDREYKLEQAKASRQYAAQVPHWQILADRVEPFMQNSFGASGWIEFLGKEGKVPINPLTKKPYPKGTVGHLENKGVMYRKLSQKQRDTWSAQWISSNKVFALVNSIHGTVKKYPAAIGKVGQWAETTTGFIEQARLYIDAIVKRVLPGGAGHLEYLTSGPERITPQQARSYVAQVFEEFKNLGIANARIRSQLIALAIAGASAEGFTGRAATDRKIKLMQDMMGQGEKAGLSKPLVLQHVLDQFAGRVSANLSETGRLYFIQDPTKAKMRDDLFKSAWKATDKQKSLLEKGGMYDVKNFKRTKGGRMIYGQPD